MSRSRAAHWSDTAFSAFKKGDYTGARSAVRKALRDAPDNAGLWALSGHIHAHLSDLETAITAFRKATRLDPRNANNFNNLSLAQFNAGRYEHAARAAQKAIDLDPNHVRALVNAANAHLTLARYDEAIALFERALAMEPDYRKARLNLNAALLKAGRAEDAYEALGSLVHDAKDGEAQKAAGHALAAQRRHALAIDSYKNALLADPEDHKAYRTIAITFRQSGRYEEALEAAEYAMKHGAARSDMLALRCVCLDKLNRFGDARRALDQIDPGDRGFDYYNTSGGHYSAISEIERAVAEYWRAEAAIDQTVLEPFNNIALTALYREDTIVTHLDRARRAFADGTAAFQRFDHWNTRPGKRLRVGLVSGDFRTHSVSFFLRSWMPHVRDADIDLIAFYNNATTDRITTELKEYFSEWHDVLDLSPHDAATIIHGADLDLLIDLSGHTSDNRLSTLAFKPAPRQASWLGFSAPTGLPEIDHWMVDDHVLTDEDGGWERPVSLGPAYLCYKPLEEVAVGDERRDTTFRFACFNNLSKVSPAMFSLWLEILKACDGSVLQIQSRVFGDPEQRQRWLETGRQAGIDPDRLELTEYVPNRETFLKMYQDVDLALDPFPYNGTTTSFEALYMGVPVLTRKGDRMVSRVGAMINENLGLQQFIARDDTHYLEAAVSAFRGEPGYRFTKTEIRSRLENSVLMDGPDFARRFAETVRRIVAETGDAASAPPSSHRPERSGAR